ncbi:hypothetical protein KAW38_04830 [Candidatus Micrarchaeota archaeon]|nr:hypothetical protein [Candidatus Micrarchaeota archaeon]
MRFVFIMVLILCIANAANIHGEVYAIDGFDNLNNSIIKISGEENHQLMVKEGNYSIELREGEYVIEGFYYEEEELIYYAKYELEVGGEPLRFDVVLFSAEIFEYIPTIYIDEIELDELEIEEETDFTYVWVGIGIILILFIVLLLFRTKKKKAKPEELDEDCKTVLRIVNENEGRITQKEIREILNWSDSKLSLVVSELEQLELIKRIKKGRKNIIKVRR